MEPDSFDRIVGHEKARKSLSLFGGKSAIERKGVIAMPRENDLEGAQDQGGKHGGQKGIPKPEPRPEPRPATRPDPGRGHASDQGIVRDERGQEQPLDKERAQQASRTDPIRR